MHSEQVEDFLHLRVSLGSVFSEGTSSWQIWQFSHDGGGLGFRR